MSTSASLTRAIALVDGNNFYVSCERVFNPGLEKSPLVILSNNDGCIVSRSQEARDLGIPMGLPFFKAKQLIQSHGLKWLSSNYTLYGDMSARMMNTLAQFSPDQEIYSIDECFLDLTGITSDSQLISYGLTIKERVQRDLGLPTCVGIGPSKTLAKLANHIAKKNKQFGGAFAWAALSQQEQIEWLKKVNVAEVWGVGRRLLEQLNTIGIKTVYDLQQANTDLIRRRFSIVLARTVAELNGVACLEMVDIKEPINKQQIISSKSFGEPIQALPLLREAVASYVCRAAEKLREQASVCHNVTVFVRTNPFAKHQPQYHNQISIPLSIGTADSRRLIHAACYGLERIYRSNYVYKKAGIILSDLHDAYHHQGDLFTKIDEEKSQQVMRTIDNLNLRYGANTLTLASTGIVVGNPHSWRMRANQKSQCFTTRWDEIALAKAC
ncbi:MAG: Y-family DNA polymerase [Betaproteobacteria bacterium]